MFLVPDTMKAVRWYGPRDMRLDDVPVPMPGPGEVLLRVDSTGICGSDVHYYLDGRIGTQVITNPPLTLGHEFAGVIVRRGEGVSPALEGARVAVEPGTPCGQCEWCRTNHYNVCEQMRFPGGPGCEGAFSEYYVARAAACFPIPDTMTMPQAAMLEPLSVAVHSVELAALKPGEIVAVLGLGPVGLMTADLARQSGALTVFGSDLHAYRAEAGLRLGLDAAFAVQPDEPGAGGGDTISKIMELTQGRGVDVAIDCTNGREGLGIAVRIVHPAGRCVLTGISGHDCDPLPVSVARRKELNLQWCRRFKNNYPAAMALVERGRVEVDALITHSMPLEKTAEAFEIVAGYRENVLKASIDRVE